MTCDLCPVACDLCPTAAVRSRAALTYAEAQLRIDDATQQDAVAVSLRGLNMLAKQLKQRRLDNG